VNSHSNDTTAPAATRNDTVAAAVATLVDHRSGSTPDRSSTPPQPSMASHTSRQLLRERIADLLCHTHRDDHERARSVVRAALTAGRASSVDDEQCQIDPAEIVLVTAADLVNAGMSTSDALLAATGTHAVTWAQIASALRRHHVNRWTIEELFTRCGLNERQRRWAIELPLPLLPSDSPAVSVDVKCDDRCRSAKRPAAATATALTPEVAHREDKSDEYHNGRAEPVAR
jgi:hypothetical protein